MNASLNLTDIEKKVFRSTFVDGLYDIFIGLFLLTFANVPLINDLGLGDFWSSMILLPVMWGGWTLVRLGKKRIVIPRMGTVQFGKQRQAKIRKMVLIGTVLSSIMLIAGFIVFLTFQGQPMRWLVPSIMSLIFLAAFVAGGLLLEFYRLFAYGILVSASVIIGELLFTQGSAPHHGIPLMFNLCGGIVLLTGVYLFLRFLKRFPDPDGGGT